MDIEREFAALHKVCFLHVSRFRPPQIVFSPTAGASPGSYKLEIIKPKQKLTCKSTRQKDGEWSGKSERLVNRSKFLRFKW